MVQDYKNKIVKGLLDMIVLEILNKRPMHGYQIIAMIRNAFGIYYGPSTIYSLLESLEKEGIVKSEWSLKLARPRKIYSLTNHGENVLYLAENSLTFVCKSIAGDEGVETTNASLL